MIRKAAGRSEARRIPNQVPAEASGRQAHAVAVLAVQGSFAEHVRRFEQLGCSCVELRQASDLGKPFDYLVLPGGESTVQAKLLHELGMFEPLRKRIAKGMPVLGTCAGLVLLAKRIEKEKTGADACSDLHGFATMPVTVKRNAYGRQLGSFHVEAEFAGMKTVPMTFIRAPRIVEVESDVEVLARVGEAIVAVRFGNQIGVSFHPELHSDDRLLEMFLALGDADAGELHRLKGLKRDVSI